MGMYLPKIDTSNLWDKTYTILKERIVRREFMPNQKLSIPDLSEQLGVSRTPVRDALARLEMDGLVRTVSKVGTFVNAIVVEDVLEIMDTRLMLEYWVIDKLKELPKEEIARSVGHMEHILQKASELIESSLEAYFKADFNLAFHIEFMKLGQNKKNTEIYMKLMDYRFFMVQSSLITKEMVTVAQQQHSDIVEVIKHGNTGDIQKIIKLHLDDSKQRLVDKIINDGGAI